MLTASELYPGLTAMQVIIQVSQHGSRPDIPADCPPALAALMQRCWEADPALRCVALGQEGEARGGGLVVVGHTDGRASVLWARCGCCGRLGRSGAPQTFVAAALTLRVLSLFHHDPRCAGPPPRKSWKT